MAQITADRVKDTTTTTGTGTITITGTAPTGFQDFDTACDVDDTFYYCIEDTTNGAWEVGIGTLASPTTISRDRALSSSNSNALVSFAAGTKTVFITLPSNTIFTAGQNHASTLGIITL